MISIGQFLDKNGWPALILVAVLAAVWKVGVFAAPLIRRFFNTVTEGVGQILQKINHILDTTIEDKRENLKHIERIAVHAERTDTALASISDRVDELRTRCVFGGMRHNGGTNS